MSDKTYVEGDLTRAELALHLAEAVETTRHLHLGPGDYLFDDVPLVIPSGFEVSAESGRTCLLMAPGAVNCNPLQIGPGPSAVLGASRGLTADAPAQTSKLSMNTNGISAGDYLLLSMNHLPVPGASAQFAQVVRVASVEGTQVNLYDSLWRTFKAAASTLNQATLVYKITGAVFDVRVGGLQIYGNGNTGTASFGILRSGAVGSQVYDIKGFELPQSTLLSYYGYGNREDGIRSEACGDTGYSDFFTICESQQTSRNIESYGSTGFGPQWRASSGVHIRDLNSVGAGYRGVKIDSTAGWTADGVFVDGAGRISAAHGNGLGITMGSDQGTLSNSILRNNTQYGLWTTGYGAGRFDAFNVQMFGNAGSVMLYNDGAPFTVGDIHLTQCRWDVAPQNGIGAVIH